MEAGKRVRGGGGRVKKVAVTLLLQQPCHSVSQLTLCEVLKVFFMRYRHLLETVQPQIGETAHASPDNALSRPMPIHYTQAAPLALTRKQYSTRYGDGRAC
ncbi:hypothetical protein INR49_028230 [Caranx melampygus]|nr:hypothetical protein INR49_028230 [Caranx melampygus]